MKNDTNDIPITLSDITRCINNHEYDSLDPLLKAIEWDLVGNELIRPKDVRRFVKSIENEEVRLDVMKFLKKYALQYFRDAAEILEFNSNIKYGDTVYVKSADENLELFQQELGFLIDQSENTGEFSGDKFKHQEVEIKNLKKEIKELQDIISKKDAELDRFKNPIKYGKRIPSTLDRSDFIKILNHLKEAGIIHPILDDDENGRRVIACYYWDASKVLFGYFVEKVSNALNLRGARFPLDWQIFEPVFLNFNELVTEAMKALSTYNNSSSLQKNRIKKAEIIDKAIVIKDFDSRYA